MKNLLAFIARYYHWLMLLILEVASGVLLFKYNSYQSSVWFTSANAVVGKIYEWDGAVRSFFSLARVNEELTLRNFYLERQVTQLRRLYGDLTADTTILERQELEFLSRYELVPAKVVSNSVNKSDNLITIDKGSNDGVEKDNSVVIPVLNVPSSRISCAIRGRGYFGYLQWYGGDPTVAYVEDIPRHARFKRGDWVETSGYSSIFPQGVLVGKIEKIYNSTDGLSYRLKVRLSTDFACLRDVYVISDKGVGEQLQLLEAAKDSITMTPKQ